VTAPASGSAVAPGGALVGPSWDEARGAAFAAVAPVDPVQVALAEADGTTLAEPLTARTDLPAFPTSSVDGYAVRGAGPWRVGFRVLAGVVPPAGLEPGGAAEIATGAMVPEGTEWVLRREHCTLTTRPGSTPAVAVVHGELPDRTEWRVPGEEARAGEELLPAGTPVTPGVVALATSCGWDTLAVRPGPRAAVRVFGDELLSSGPPGAGRVRDALGPTLPAWLRRLGARPVPGGAEPVEDTLEAHVAAIAEAAATADLVVTTGGTMHGPVDHLHAALDDLGAGYVVDTVQVRPGFPMLLAVLPDGTPVVGLPGNPQSAVIALLTLAAPVVAALGGRSLPPLARVVLGEPVPGRGPATHLALARVEPGPDGPPRAHLLSHAGSAMLRGVALADGFAVVRPGQAAAAGDEVDLLPVPLLPGERP